MAKKPAKKPTTTKRTRKATPKGPPRTRAKSTRPTTKRTRPAPQVYFFGGGAAEGDRSMRAVLGGKGAGLAEMTNAGLPVPPGFTIATTVCARFFAGGARVPAAVEREMAAQLRRLEALAGARLGAADRPLLVSVRSGAQDSMPGMMDTILNLGLNDAAVEGLTARTGNGRFAVDSYRRFIQMFGAVVLEIPKAAFERELDAVKAAHGVELDTALDEAALREVVRRYQAVVRQATGRAFPQDPRQQLRQARDAVFRSWQTPRAIEYRRIYGIADTRGTAVNVQAMVFGNTGLRSATGVGFTRNPATGAKEFYGEFLVNAQGEDVVAGIRTPQPIRELARVMPRAYAQLRRITSRLERHYRDVQDFEFTIEDDTLYMLQTRSGKRTGRAAVVIATDLVAERVVTTKEALLLVDPDALSQLLAPVFDPAAWAALPVVTRGLPASPGAASGQVVFSADEAVRWAQAGQAVVLARKETVPDDIHGLHVAEGVVTATGGMTSHAAVVGRQMGKPAVVGAGELRIDEEAKTLTVHGQVVREGAAVSFDGLTGEVKLGAVGTQPSEILQVVHGTRPAARSTIYQRFTKLLGWADKVSRLGVRANADQPDQAAVAQALGAQGIGLVRTEHMFFGEDRIPGMRRMILAETEEERRAALAELLPLQRQDFVGIFRAMHGAPVTIRLIDPPLHEFLPKREELMIEVAQLEVTQADPARLAAARALLARVEQLHEFNPMMGHRGVRLGISYPEITEMQTRAIIEAACEVKRAGHSVVAEIMIPLVGLVREFTDQKAVVDRVAAETMRAQGVRVTYLVGTMLEVPRAALIADAIAAEAEFFSFGTNDLTQLTFGFSRDDAGKFLRTYRGAADPGPRPVHHARRGGSGVAGADGGRAGAAGPAVAQAGRVRRAQRRCGIGAVLRAGRARLCQRLALSDPHRALGRRPRRPRRHPRPLTRPWGRSAIAWFSHHDSPVLSYLDS